MDARRQRGLALAKTKGDAIRPIVGAKVLVPSATNAGGYVVDTVEESCTCPDWMEFGGHGRSHRCKHLWAALYLRGETELPDGNVLMIQEKVRLKYPRDHRASNDALVALPYLAPKLIADLVQPIPIPKQEGPGHPRVPLRYIAQSAIIKTFERRAARQTVEALSRSQARGLLAQIPSYNTLLREMANPELTPHLQNIVNASIAPLVPIEHDFAVDSTGISTCVYRSWNEHKWGKLQPTTTTGRKHHWLKVSACVGTATHVITAVVVTGPSVGDATLLPELLAQTAKNGFSINKVTGDAAYLSTMNIRVAEQLGAKPYYAFKSNSTGTSSPEMARLYHTFMADQARYLDEYHDRSNVEAAFSMLKQEFGGFVRARKPIAQYNEILCKVICHNLSCIVTAMYEMGIDAKFGESASRVRVAL